MTVTPSKAYQWNTNVDIKLSVPAVKAGFSYSKHPPGKVVDKNEDGTFTIPQPLMEQCGFLNVYAINDSDDAFEHREIRIIRREKPELYVQAEEVTTIDAVVRKYLSENPPAAGATAEQAAQIEQNKTDIAALKQAFVDDRSGFSASASGVMGSTFEGFCGFPGKGVYTADAQRGNAEILGNWIMAVIREIV